MFCLKNIAFFFILLTILVVNMMRFVNLECIPKGFYGDEISSTLNSNSLATEGVDIQGKKWPLFSVIGFGSPKPPTQTYPLALWIKAFGFSITSVRSFSVCAFTLGLLGIFLLARILGGPTCAWLTLLAASISPWGWMFSRIAIESTLGPVFLIWGVFFFLRNSRWFDMVLSAFFINCAMYSYPPTCLHSLLIIPLLIGFQFRQKKLRPWYLGIFIIAFAICTAPLYISSHQESMQFRFNSLSIFSQTSSWKDITITFTKNYLSHLSSKFLFISGDNNIRHSTGHFGELSWLDMLGICSGLLLACKSIKKKKTPSHLVIFLLLAAAAGIVPAALTWEGLPHALRALGAQPFIELLVGYCLAKTIDLWPPLLLVSSLTAIVFAVCFLITYFNTYPDESADAWGAQMRIDAEHCQTDEDWINYIYDHHPEIMVRYFILRNYHKPCALWFLTSGDL